MKLTLLLLALAASLLVGCSIQNEDFTQSESIESANESIYDDTIESNPFIKIESTSAAEDSDEKTNIAYESIYKEIEEYFRVFYDKSNNFNVILKNSTVISSVESRIKGYFYDNSLLKLSLSRFGEQKSFFDEYYIINSNLIYCTQQIKYTLPNEYVVFKEEYRHYYIINGEVYQLSPDEMELINCSCDDNELRKNFEESLNDISGSSELYNSQNSYFTLEDNAIFSQMTEEKSDFFINFYKNRSYEAKYFTVDFPGNECEFNNITALYNGNHLEEIRVNYPQENVYRTYEYYLISNEFIYAIVKDDIYDDSIKKTSKNFIGTSYEEYFIVESKVMQYNSMKQDLQELTDSEAILTNFNIAKNCIKN